MIGLPKMIFRPRHLMRGATLIELMIAITLGLLMMAALTTMYVNQTAIRRELDKNNRMTDNGRYAIQLLTENIRHAGYFSDYDPSGQAVPTSADPCTTDSANIRSALKVAVQAINAPNFSTAATLPASCGLVSSMLKAGSDIVVVRRVETKNSAAIAGGHFLQASLCATDVDQVKISTSPGDLTLRKKDCATINDTQRMVVQIYFVASYNRPGDGIPTLKRLELMPQGTTIPAGSVLANGSIGGSTLGGPGFVLTPLVEGVEFMKIDYGIDSNTVDGLGQADSYSAAPVCPTSVAGTCAEAANIVDAKIYLLARNIENTAHYQDQKRYQMGTAGEIGPGGLDSSFKRQLYTQYVRLTNAAGRRETP
jgi:type IV pilus assembly protein PilW